MQEDLKDPTNWLNTLIHLIKIGQSNNFLDEDGEFQTTLTSKEEKISILIKIEPTNIIHFKKRNDASKPN